MKDKNKKLVIVVVSLLLVIGVSFAYFTVSILLKGDGSKVDFTTATLKGSKLVVEGNLVFDDIDMYPGHQNVSSIKVTATGDNELIPYHVIWEGENGLNTSLNYVVYKTSSKVDVSVQCEKEQEVMNGAKMYYEECSIQNVESLGSVVAEGTIREGKVKEILVKDEFITASPTGEEVYYYVILEYPNLGESQNGDIGNSFKGKVTVSLSETEPDINIIAAYIEEDDGTYKEVSEIPQSGYTLNIEKSVCNNGASVKWNNINNELITTNLSKSGTSCYLYFQKYEPYQARTYILSNIDSISDERDTNITGVLTENTTGTIYTAEDDWGKSYVYAGAVDNNWLKFAGYYWRIVRINGDGSIRLIYSGDSNSGPVTVGDATQIVNSSVNFNDLGDDNAYIGYMYGERDSNSYEMTHMNVYDSTIKQIIDNWYIGNILKKGFDSFISLEAGFCNDRKVYDGTMIYGKLGYGDNITGYAVINRFMKDAGTWNTIQKPTLKCGQINRDLFTSSDSTKGNFALKYPIGLISADEVVYAGGFGNGSNSEYYLNNNKAFWTMTPFSYNSGSSIFIVSSGLLYGASNPSNGIGVRPVINLRADVQLMGIGTITDPYVVVGAE